MLDKIARYFNPRLREGGDKKQIFFSASLSISIHASAREATRASFFVSHNRIFQSTPPRGRRLLIQFRNLQKTNFNPRLREGGDFDSSRCSASTGISIHASAREATRSRIWQHMRCYISIHASAREATIGSIKSTLGFGNFNPRLREGGDPFSSIHHHPYGISIHASAREATIISSQTGSLSEFQSTPPRGRRPGIQAGSAGF